MNVYILGLPKSGRTTIAKAIDQKINMVHIDACAWVKSTFREQNTGEHEQHYQEEYEKFFFDRLKLNHNMCVDNVRETMLAYRKEYSFIIEGISLPQDFIKLFNYDKDVVVFLNRTDNESYYRDHDNISISTMKDYCFWMASANLLDKKRWLEYNFKIPGEQDDSIKILGSKNSVFLVKSIDKVINHLYTQLNELKNDIPR